MTTAKPVALVTGASSGIGKAAAIALVGAGFEVVGTSRNTSDVAALDGVTFLDLDVIDDVSVSRVVERVIERFGRLDVLVNNAGTGAAGAAEESSVAQIQRVFDINFFGLVRMTKAVLPHMRAAGTGRIINISSVLGLHEARDRGLLRIVGPRGSGVRHPGAPRRARLHQDGLRREGDPTRRTAPDLRRTEKCLRRCDGACHGGRR